MLEPITVDENLIVEDIGAIIKNVRLYLDMSEEDLSNYNIIHPKPIINSIKNNSHFSELEQEDANEFMEFIFDVIHTETKFNQKMDSNYLAKLVDNKDPKMEIAKDLAANPSLIHSLFSIIMKSNLKCLQCGHTNFSFESFGGEILGIAGIAGSGQRELLEAIAGLQKYNGGEISYVDFNSNTPVNLKELSPASIRELGIRLSFVPEDRLGMGLAPSFSMTDNMMLKTYSEGKTPFVDRKSARERAKKLIDKLGIVTPSTETPVRRLSGGNVQKILVGREIESSPNVIITACPGRGLDINSSYQIYDILNEQKKNGVGILFVGEDLDVMLALCDKILVLCDGKVSGIVDARTTTKEEIGLLMTKLGGKEEN